MSRDETWVKFSVFVDDDGRLIITIQPAARTAHVLQEAFDAARMFTVGEKPCQTTSSSSLSQTTTDTR